MDPSDQLPFLEASDAADAATSEPSADAAPDSAEAAPGAAATEPVEEAPVDAADTDHEDDGHADDAAVAPLAPPPTAPERRVVPGPSFQAAAGIQGRQFAEQCDTLLGTLGYELRGRRVVTDIGIEIDQEAVSPSGRVVWFEYKGSVQGNRPGLRRTDTLKKAIANGALLRALADPAPYVVITSHLPEAGAGAAMLDAALRLRYVADVVCLYDPKATQRLRGW
jgi:hypothetical protein